MYELIPSHLHVSLSRFSNASIIVVATLFSTAARKASYIGLRNLTLTLKNASVAGAPVDFDMSENCHSVSNV